ncbi:MULTISPECIES: GNAT family N-acetyltransferase [unclassified Bacillus (in: firmicutes)]|uniref:GNAT family N-acetyltransferase n=1 Tax=unclassified Bacillus (in: firmicutes) TaxID=185979 RepID=UPI0008EA1985|nr:MULTISPECIES: N-acetyltransferase [unclassified Bacillus (in: firmicutes)]SFA90966.1 putative acetyltransferase [Bacillus sp. UNCCL13]SFQ85450.1 putative acetyltransferase [Bacillus sp. cl95]
MINVIVESIKHKEEVAKVNTLAFGKENEAALVNGIRNSKEFIPELSLVAVDENDQVVGHILFSKIYITSHGEKLESVALAPMAVLPTHQGKGIGSTLVQFGLRRCAELGYEHVIVLGHPNFYPKFGFERASKYGIMPPFPVPDEVFMAIELVPGGLSGFSGTVAYPGAFNNV